MEDKLQPEYCAQLLSALAAPERLQIVRLLREGPKNVTEIADHLGVPLVNISHHLLVLRNAGLLSSKRSGRFVIYSLSPGVLQDPSEESGPTHINLGCCRLEIPKTDK